MWYAFSNLRVDRAQGLSRDYLDDCNHTVLGARMVVISSTNEVEEGGGYKEAFGGTDKRTLTSQKRQLRCPMGRSWIYLV